MIVSSGAMGAAAGAGTAWPKPSEEKQRASNTALVWRGRERGAGVVMGECGGYGDVGGFAEEDVGIRYCWAKQRRSAGAGKRSIVVSF